MVSCIKCAPCQTRCGGLSRGFKDNYYVSSVLGIAHPILNRVGSCFSARKEEASTFAKKMGFDQGPVEKEEFQYVEILDTTDLCRKKPQGAQVKLIVSEPAKQSTVSKICRVLCCISGTAFLATAVFGIFQAAAIHWALIASITALLAGAGVSIGSLGVVPLIMGCCLLVGFSIAYLENREQVKNISPIIF